MAKGSANKGIIHSHITEKNAYSYINKALKDLGWDTRNPARNPHGQVYTDNQALEHPELKKGLGIDRPENVVRITETKFWVIEAKSKRTEIDKAIGEAEDYARDINDKSSVKAIVISGVAGNDDDGYLVRNKLLVGEVFTPIKLNDKDTTGLLSPSLIDRLLIEGKAELQDVPLDEAVFLTTAEAINTYLHRGAINKNDRARVMAALLLALVDDTPPNVDANPRVLIKDINSRAETVLERNDKKEFFPFIQIQLPAAKDNHIKFRKAIVQTLQALTNLNIRSTMTSGADMLGKFYEVFLKYGNGAKEIGIVLTPRHLTRFAADILDIDYSDIVYDPACGTGGFLVAAFDKVRSKYPTNSPQVEQFKLHGLFGVDQDPVVTALAIVNMIFRNDGKNHIIEGNSFAKHLERIVTDGVPTGRFSPVKPTDGQEAATRVLMNPPFSLRVTDEKEYRFIQQGLGQLVDGGLLFSILPISVLFEAGAVKEWRLNKLLAENTLLAVITFAPESFYPSGVRTLGVVVRKGLTHPKGQSVLWARVSHDGFMKLKGKRLLSAQEPNELSMLTPLVQAFVGNPSFPVAPVPELVKACAIDWGDPILELIPEAYLDSSPRSIDEISISIDHVIRGTIGFLLTHGMEKGMPKAMLPEKWPKVMNEGHFQETPITTLFDVQSGQYHNASSLDKGIVPLVSCGDTDNGVTSWISPNDDATLYFNVFTVAYNGQPLTTKFHPYKFVTKDDVAVCQVKGDIPFETAIFGAAMLNLEQWRFSYGRKCFREKLKRFNTPMPVNESGELDHEWMRMFIQSHPYWAYFRDQSYSTLNNTDF